MYNKENIRYLEDQSTDIQQYKTYSSRYQKIKKKFIHQPVFHHLEKSAIIIQRYWRLHLSIRRKLYIKYISQLKANNAILHLSNHTNSSINQYLQQSIHFYQQLQQTQIKHIINPTQIQIKKFMKDCVAVAFRLQKKQNIQQQLYKIKQSNQQLTIQISKANQYKQILKNKIIQQFSNDQQISLKCIRENSSVLLKLITENNILENKLKQIELQNQKKTLKN